MQELAGLWFTIVFIFMLMTWNLLDYVEVPNGYKHVIMIQFFTNHLRKLVLLRLEICMIEMAR